MTGSANNESFAGVGGNDTIDGGAGFDRVRYDTGSDVTGLVVNLALGQATGSANGTAFTQTLSNIEWVRGSNNADTINGSAGNDRLDGRDGVDRLNASPKNARRPGAQRTGLQRTLRGIKSRIWVGW